MTGPEGALFGPMANTYAFAICGALMLAVTLAPVLCSFLFTNKKEEHDTWLDKVMKKRYLRALRLVLRHRRLTLAVMGSLDAHGLLPRAAPRRRVHAAAGGREPLDPGPAAADRLARGRGAVRAEAPRGDRHRCPRCAGVMSHVGRPDDGTDVTSFFNVEFNVPLTPMETWRTRPITVFGHEIPSKIGGHEVSWLKRPITREEIQDELTAKFKEFPGGQLQLLAAHPRQRRGGPLGRQGGELGQALRQRPRRPSRRSGQRVVEHPQVGPRDRERRALPHRRPAQPGDPDRPRPVRPLRDQRRRRRGRGAGGRSAAGRSRRWSRGRSSTTSCCGCRSTSATTPT